MKLLALFVLMLLIVKLFDCEAVDVDAAYCGAVHVDAADCEAV